jgi:hypothetical protein
MTGGDRDRPGELIVVPPGRYDWLYLELAGPCPGSEPWCAEAWLHYAGAVDPEWLHFTPGATAARLPVPRPLPLRQVRLPRLESPRVRSLTPIAAGQPAAGMR